MKPKAYSYIRFSTPEQSKGDSLRRQLAASEAYAKEHGLELDDSLNMRDLGRSAYKGVHRTKGTLGSFLKQVESGAITPDSVLIVESLDRLSREQVLDALTQFTSIIRAGIRVVTLADGMEYDEQSINANFGQLLMSLVIMSRAHEESLIKGKRVAAAWDRKRQEATKGRKLTAKCPAWLKLSKDRRTFKVIEEAAAAVWLIFEMKAQGTGSETIVRTLNADPNIWKPSAHARNRRGGWRKSYVEKIIRSPAVIGEFQPHKMVDGKRQPAGDPIPGYFPAVVERDLFHRVQAILARNASIPGRAGGANGAVANVFGHIAKCARCGGSMRHVNKGPRPKGGQYLVCEQAREGIGCDKTPIRYDRLERLLLRFCRGLDAHDLLTDEADKAHEEALLRHQLRSVDGELTQVERQVENLTASIADEDDATLRQVLKNKLSTTLERRAERQQVRNEITAALSERGTPDAVKEHLASVEDLIERMDVLEGAERGELRRRLRHQLHLLLDRIEVEPGHDDDEDRLTLTFSEGTSILLKPDGNGRVLVFREDRVEDPLLYCLDSQGNLLDEDEVDQKRVDRQKEVDKMVAQAFQRRRVNPNIT